MPSSRALVASTAIGVDVAERDGRAGSSERLGDRGADPAASADDDRGLATED